MGGALRRNSRLMVLGWRPSNRAVCAAEHPHIRNAVIEPAG